MSYISVPRRANLIYPLNKHGYTESVVRNLKSAAMRFGFLGPHGRRLAAYGDTNLGDYYTTAGTLEGSLNGIPGHRRKRWKDHFNNACANGIISYRENLRSVVYVPVVATIASVATVINAGDLVWWDAINQSVRSAPAFTWTTNLGTTQQAFSKVFLGVAMDSYPSGTPSWDPYNGIMALTVRVDISPNSYWDFTDYASEGHNAGDIMAPAQGTGNTLSATLIRQVSPIGAQGFSYSDGIARVARVDRANTTSVLVRVQSAFWGSETSSVEGM